MKLFNQNGQAVYYNSVTKHGNIRYIIQAASGQTLLDRDKRKVKSRSFESQLKAERYLRHLGYNT